MKCATNISISLAFFTVTALLIASSHAGRLSIHSVATATSDGMNSTATSATESNSEGEQEEMFPNKPRPELLCIDGVGATDLTTATGPIGAEMALHSLEWVPGLKANVKDPYKWDDATCSKDPTMLENMLGFCRGRERKYALQIRQASRAAWRAKEWGNLTKIIEAMCMNLGKFESNISRRIRTALNHTNAPYLAAILEGMAGKMDEMPKGVGMALANTVILGPEDYPGCAEKIHKHITHAGLKELSLIAMKENREERLAALAVCLKHKRNWPEHVIEEMAQLTYEDGEYHILELLLEMKPSNREDLYNQSVELLHLDILHGNFDNVSKLIRIFNIPPAKVHSALKHAVRKCLVDHDGPVDLGNIVTFINSDPQQHKLAVDTALRGLAPEKIAKLGAEALKRYKFFQNWIIAVNARQGKRNPEMHNAHWNICHPMARQELDI